MLASLLAAAALAGTNLSVVAYSIPTNVFPKLEAAYGNGVSFSNSFAASEVQSKAVAAGLPADVVNFSITTDMDRLVQSKQVDKTWANNPYHGIVSKSVVVFVLRNGNPKNLHTWADLVKPGVQIVQPNPISSGGARWDAMAAYGQALAQGKTPAQALTYLNAYFKNIVAQDKSARDALNTFLSGKGDVLVGYESEALPAIAAGNPVDIVRPSYTLLIQNPIAVTGSSQNPTQAKAFVQFLLTPPAQTIWAQDGYRPVDPTVLAKFKKSFPTPHGVFKISQFGLGGWTAVTKKFFDPSNGIITKIESGL